MRIGHTRKGKRSHTFQHQGVQGFNTESKPPIKHQGIERVPRARKAPDLPLSDRHKAVLKQVTEEPVRPTVIANHLGLTRSGVVSTLYALADRGLVERVHSTGWKRTAPGDRGPGR